MSQIAVVSGELIISIGRIDNRISTIHGHIGYSSASSVHASLRARLEFQLTPQSPELQPLLILDRRPRLWAAMSPTPKEAHGQAGVERFRQGAAPPADTLEGPGRITTFSQVLRGVLGYPVCA